MAAGQRQDGQRVFRYGHSTSHENIFSSHCIAAATLLIWTGWVATIKRMNYFCTLIGPFSAPAITDTPRESPKTPRPFYAFSNSMFIPAALRLRSRTIWMPLDFKKIMEKNVFLALLPEEIYFVVKNVQGIMSQKTLKLKNRGGIHSQNL